MDRDVLDVDDRVAWEVLKPWPARIRLRPIASTSTRSPDLEAWRGRSANMSSDVKSLLIGLCLVAARSRPETGQGTPAQVWWLALVSNVAVGTLAQGVVGGTAAKGFLGGVNGHRVAMFAHKEGPCQGELAFSFAPSAGGVDP